MESLGNQIYAFAAAFVSGMAAGFCYDYYRVARGVFRLRKMGTCLGDIIFWLVATALVFYLLLLGNWGVVRPYVFIGLGLGAITYFQFFSGGMIRLFRLKFYLIHQIWVFTVKVVLLLWRVVTFPFRLVIIILSYPLGFLGGLIKKTQRKLKVLFYNLAGRRVEKAVNRMKSKLSRLVFWKRKKGE
ncbi:MAG: Spore cortex protein YabQ (Spore_YabQ) [Pelotomaculum sp. PtaU1.Bin035]|nr:MAG: Spore cortex protein YabQ (Spore_YabQ) [Pelotomaculum sp. PtaU1.Bin035]